MGYSSDSLPMDFRHSSSSDGSGAISYTRHNVYYCESISLVIENCLFKIPFHLFDSSSSDSIFHARPSVGSESNALILEGVRQLDFERLLHLLLPMTVRPEPLTKEEWVSVLRLSTLWHLDEIRDLAIETMSAFEIEPVEMITLSQEFNVLAWYQPACRQLATRREVLSKDDGRKIGLEAVLEILHLREGARSQLYTLEMAEQVAAATERKRLDQEAIVERKRKEEDAIAERKRKADEEFAESKRKVEEEKAATTDLKRKVEEETAERKRKVEEEVAERKRKIEEKAFERKRKAEEEAAERKRKIEEVALERKRMSYEANLERKRMIAELAEKKKLDKEEHERKAEVEATAAAKKAEEAASAIAKKAEEEAVTVVDKAEEDAVVAAKKVEEDAAAIKSAEDEAAKKKAREEATAIIYVALEDISF